jgi:tripeptidyl-peptidase-1
MVAPSQSSLDAVHAWLRGAGVSKGVVSPGGDYVRATVTVGEAERLFPGAQYAAFVDRTEHRVVHRVRDPEAFALPAELREHVDFVEPTVTFPPKSVRVHSSKDKGKKKENAARAAPPPPAGLKTNPSTLRDMYNIGDREASCNASCHNSQQVASFLNNSFSPKDLQMFFRQYYPKAEGRTPTHVFGNNNDGNPTLEASLDVEYIMAIGGNVDTIVWATPGERPYPGGENEPFLTWVTAVVDGATDGSRPLSNVISVSYADEEFVVDPTFQQRCDVEFMKLGAMGASLFFGSGDDGVTGDHGVCPNMQYVPWWPASSPYVTGVGATEQYNNRGASFSGGGFSNRYAIPSYQADAVAGFKKKSKAMPTMYNQTGAGFPDVAANGLQFWTVIGGIPDEVGGTSAATPTVAGIVSLLNDARLQNNKTSLGLVNPLFYAHPECFKDIVGGQNSGGGGCNGTGGFNAVEGWDPVTGIGSPKFDKLLALALSLP